MHIKGYVGIESLEKKYGPMTVGMFIKSWREADEISQTVFAKKLKISRANLCDIEKGRKFVSPGRAVRIAKKLGVSETFLITLSMQDMLRAAKLNYIVELKSAS